MKSILVTAVLFGCFTIVLTQNAPIIQGGHYSSETKSIEIDVQYGGGCAEHYFLLEIGFCRESYPVQCDAKLYDLTIDDDCDALIDHTVSISLNDVGLDSRYYAGGSIQIQGSAGSKVLIKLPF